MKITFHTHACAEIHAGPVRLLTDPWLTDRPFHRGWALALPPAEPPSGILGRATHIWISHEHGDHFSPATLRELSAGRRGSVEVLYQATPEKGVLRFCEELGYRVREISEKVCLSVATATDPEARSVHLTTGRAGLYDTWMLLTHDGQRILNLVDCDVDPDALAEEVLNTGTPLDVLLVQWQVARACGDSFEHVRIEGQRVLDQAERYMRVLKPRFTIPFASFARFSHIENRWMDPYTNRLPMIVERIERAGSIPVVLKPGETFDLSAFIGRGQEAALRKWDLAYSYPVNDEGHSPKRAFGELRRAFDAFVAKMAEDNGLSVMKLISDVVGPLKIEIGDLADLGGGEASRWALSLDGTYTPSPGEAPDVTLTSDALLSALKQPWGFDALLASGRVLGTPEGLARMMRWSDVATRNHHGYVAGARVAFGRKPEKPLVSTRVEDAPWGEVESRHQSTIENGEEP